MTDIADAELPAPEEQDTGSSAVPFDEEVPPPDPYEQGEGHDDPEPAEDDDGLTPDEGGEA